MESKVCSVDDKFIGGEFKGQKFIDIFKFGIGYLEWIIKDTEICFHNLDDFFRNGKPLELDYDSLLPHHREAVFDYIMKNNKLASSGSKRLTIDNVILFKKKGWIKDENFKEVDYKFSPLLILKNADKLKHI